MRYADAMGSLSLSGGPIIIEQNLMLDLVHMTAAPPWLNTMDDTVEAIEGCISQLDPALTQVVTDVRHLSTDKVKVILGLQNVPEDVNYLELLHEDIRVVTLAYDNQSRFGSGCLNMGMGLTTDGDRTLYWIAEIGLILDISHVSHATARDILAFVDREHSDMPIMASHSACYAMYPHCRNLPDATLRAIAERGGVIGIPTLGFILGNEWVSNIDAFLMHVLHAVNICGIDAICLGTAGHYINTTPEAELKMFMMAKEKIDPYGTLGVRYPNHPKGFQGAKKMKVIAKYLRPLLGSANLEKVMGGNLMGFFQRSIPCNQDA